MMNNKISVKNLLRQNIVFAALAVSLSLILGIQIIHAETKASKEDQIYATLRNAGYSHAGTCGIMGNMAVENPDFVADLEANKGVTYGLFQWSDVGNRRSNLVKWCNNRLLYHNRIDGQMAFAMFELSGGDSIACRANDFLKTTDDPKMAAMEFAAGFERCVGPTPNPSNDAVYEGTIYPEYYGRTYQALKSRIEKAEYYYDKYLGSPINEENVIEINIVPTAGIIAEMEDAIEADTYRTLNIEIPQRESHPVLYKIMCILVGYFFGTLFLPHAIRKRRGLSNFGEVNRMFDKKDPATLERIKHTAYVVLWDVLKCYLGFGVAFAISRGDMGRDVILWTGLGLILGNGYPVWNRFRGGIGATATMLVICTYMPIWGPICCLLGLIITMIFKSLPLGVLMITVLILPFAFMLRGPVAGIIILSEMLLMFIKQRRHLIRLIQRKVVPGRKEYLDNRRARRISRA